MSLDKGFGGFGGDFEAFSIRITSGNLAFIFVPSSVVTLTKQNQCEHLTIFFQYKYPYGSQKKRERLCHTSISSH